VPAALVAVHDPEQRDIFSPFQKLNGEPNLEIITALNHKIIGLLIANPGIPENAIANSISLFGADNIKKLLSKMEESGLIYSQTLECSKPSLFSTNNEEHTEIIKCFFAQPQCIT